MDEFLHKNVFFVIFLCGSDRCSVVGGVGRFGSETDAVAHEFFFGLFFLVLQTLFALGLFRLFRLFLLALTAKS